MTMFKQCWLEASHFEQLANGIDYFCEHHAQMRQRQGGEVKPIEVPSKDGKAVAK
jgi:hypothetical protein